MKFTKATIFPAAAKFGPALVLALVACSVTFAQEVRANFMPETDFSKFHAYAWVTTYKACLRWAAVRPDPGRSGQAGDRFTDGGQGLHQSGGRR